MKVGIIGAGIFGCTTAIKLHDAGHEVEIIERAENIMVGATLKNQQRLHRGYHYPRSIGTALECKRESERFKAEYGDAIFGGGDHFYAIAKKASQTTPNDYIKFMEDVGLEFDVVSTPHINMDEVDLVVKVPEESISVARLRHLVRRRLADKNIRVHYNVEEPDYDAYDHIVVACYTSNNEVLNELDIAVEQYQFELVEKPVVTIPSTRLAARTSIVIMDGPFCSLDPCGTQHQQYLMGHVKHAIIHTHEGLYPRATMHQRRLQERTLMAQTYCWDKMRDAGTRFIPALEYSKRVASYFVMRAVLPNVHETDRRPTIVTEHNDHVTSIFSGKIPSAISAAESVCEILERQELSTADELMARQGGG